MSVSSCIVVWMPLFKVKSIRAVCCVLHRPFLPQRYSPQSRAAAVTWPCCVWAVCRGAVAVLTDIFSTAPWGSPLLLYTPFFHGRSGPCSILSLPHFCDSRFSLPCFLSSPSGRSHWFPARKYFFGDQI